MPLEWLVMMCAARNQIRIGKWLLCITVPAVTDVCRAQPAHSQVARFRFNGQPLQVHSKDTRSPQANDVPPDNATRFLIRKPGIERRAGHGFVVFPYEAGSTLITNQLPIDAWHDVIGEPTFADAILDRLVHNAYRVELDGQSMRKTKLKIGDESTQN
jgi:hypothetical protein